VKEKNSYLEDEYRFKEMMISLCIPTGRNLPTIRLQFWFWVQMIFYPNPDGLTSLSVLLEGFYQLLRIGSKKYHYFRLLSKFLYISIQLSPIGHNIYLIPLEEQMYLMDRRRILDKKKLGLRSSETLIHCQESQFINCIGVEETFSSSSMPKPNGKKAVKEAPKKKLKDLRTKSVPRYTFTNFQQLAR